MSSAATLAVIIPPSIPMILYAVMAETSVVQLFVAGIVPGVIGGFALMGMAYGLARRYNLPREDAFSLGARAARRRARRCGRSCCRSSSWAASSAASSRRPRAPRSPWSRRSSSAWSSIASSTSPNCGRRCIEGGVQTAVVMLLVATSALLGTYLTEVQAPQALARVGRRASRRTSGSVLALLNLLFLLLGMFLHSAAAIILVVPVVMPLVQGGRHRPGALRAHRHHQPRHRPADAAGRERADGRELDRQGVGLGGDAGERLVHRACWSACCCWSPTCRSPAWAWSSSSIAEARRADDRHDRRRRATARSRPSCSIVPRSSTR